MATASIFLSYRQSDARAWAVALRDELVQAFGIEEVFFDTDSLHAGRWSDQIALALDGCKVLLVVIGGGWLTAHDADGRRRLDDPDDVHRREIERALGRADVVVMPILVDGAGMPPAGGMPASLRGLTAQQALSWSPRADHRALDRVRLCASVQTATGLAPRLPQVRRRWRFPLAVLAGGLSGTLALGTGFSIAAMPLNMAEMFVVFGASAALTALCAAVWRNWRRPA